MITSHTIERLKISLVNRRATPAVKEALNAHLEELLEMINKVFDLYSEEMEDVVFDRIELNLGSLTLQEFDTSVKRQLEDYLATNLVTLPKGWDGVGTKPTGDYIYDEWDHILIFLETGYSDYFVERGLRFDQVVARIIAREPARARQLISRAIQKEQLKVRLEEQVTEPTWAQLVELSKGTTDATDLAVLSAMELLAGISSSWSSTLRQLKTLSKPKLAGVMEQLIEALEDEGFRRRLGSTLSLGDLKVLFGLSDQLQPALQRFEVFQEAVTTLVEEWSANDLKRVLLQLSSIEEQDVIAVLQDHVSRYIEKRTLGGVSPLEVISPSQRWLFEQMALLEMSDDRQQLVAMLTQGQSKLSDKKAVRDLITRLLEAGTIDPDFLMGLPFRESSWRLLLQALSQKQLLSLLTALNPIAAARLRGLLPLLEEAVAGMQWSARHLGAQIEAGLRAVILRLIRTRFTAAPDALVELMVLVFFGDHRPPDHYLGGPEDRGLAISDEHALTVLLTSLPEEATAYDTRSIASLLDRVLGRGTLTKSYVLGLSYRETSWDRILAPMGTEGLIDMITALSPSLAGPLTSLLFQLDRMSTGMHWTAQLKASRKDAALQKAIHLLVQSRFSVSTERLLDSMVREFLGDEKLIAQEDLQELSRFGILSDEELLRLLLEERPRGSEYPATPQFIRSLISRMTRRGLLTRAFISPFPYSQRAWDRILDALTGDQCLDLLAALFPSMGVAAAALISRLDEVAASLGWSVNLKSQRKKAALVAAIRLLLQSGFRATQAELMELMIREFLGDEQLLARLGFRDVGSIEVTSDEAALRALLLDLPTSRNYPNTRQAIRSLVARMIRGGRLTRALVATLPYKEKSWGRLLETQSPDQVMQIIKALEPAVADAVASLVQRLEKATTQLQWSEDIKATRRQVSLSAAVHHLVRTRFSVRSEQLLESIAEEYLADKGLVAGLGLKELKRLEEVTDPEMLRSFLQSPTSDRRLATSEAIRSMVSRMMTEGSFTRSLVSGVVYTEGSWRRLLGPLSNDQLSGVLNALSPSLKDPLTTLFGRLEKMSAVQQWSTGFRATRKKEALAAAIHLVVRSRFTVSKDRVFETIVTSFLADEHLIAAEDLREVSGLSVLSTDEELLKSLLLDLPGIEEHVVTSQFIRTLITRMTKQGSLRSTLFADVPYSSKSLDRLLDPIGSDQLLDVLSALSPAIAVPLTAVMSQLDKLGADLGWSENQKDEQKRQALNQAIHLLVQSRFRAHLDTVLELVILGFLGEEKLADQRDILEKSRLQAPADEETLRNLLLALPTHEAFSTTDPSIRELVVRMVRQGRLTRSAVSSIPYNRVTWDRVLHPLSSQELMVVMNAISPLLARPLDALVRELDQANAVLQDSATHREARKRTAVLAAIHELLSTRFSVRSESLFRVAVSQFFFEKVQSYYSRDDFYSRPMGDRWLKAMAAETYAADFPLLAQYIHRDQAGRLTIGKKAGEEGTEPPRKTEISIERPVFPTAAELDADLAAYDTLAELRPTLDTTVEEESTKAVAARLHALQSYLQTGLLPAPIVHRHTLAAEWHDLVQRARESVTSLLLVLRDQPGPLHRLLSLVDVLRYRQLFPGPGKRFQELQEFLADFREMVRSTPLGPARARLMQNDVEMDIVKALLATGKSGPAIMKDAMSEVFRSWPVSSASWLQAWEQQPDFRSGTLKGQFKDWLKAQPPATSLDVATTSAPRDPGLTPAEIGEDHFQALQAYLSTGVWQLPMSPSEVMEKWLEEKQPLVLNFVAEGFEQAAFRTRLVGLLPADDVLSMLSLVFPDRLVIEHFKEFRKEFSSHWQLTKGIDHPMLLALGEMVISAASTIERQAFLESFLQTYADQQGYARLSEIQQVDDTGTAISVLRKWHPEVISMVEGVIKELLADFEGTRESRGLEEEEDVAEVVLSAIDQGVLDAAFVLRQQLKTDAWRLVLDTLDGDEILSFIRAVAPFQYEGVRHLLAELQDANQEVKIPSGQWDEATREALIEAALVLIGSSFTTQRVAVQQSVFEILFFQESKPSYQSTDLRTPSYGDLLSILYQGREAYPISWSLIDRIQIAFLLEREGPKSTETPMPDVQVVRDSLHDFLDDGAWRLDEAFGARTISEVASWLLDQHPDELEDLMRDRREETAVRRLLSTLSADQREHFMSRSEITHPQWKALREDLLAALEQSKFPSTIRQRLVQESTIDLWQMRERPSSEEAAVIQKLAQTFVRTTGLVPLQIADLLRGDQSREAFPEAFPLVAKLEDQLSIATVLPNATVRRMIASDDLLGGYQTSEYLSYFFQTGKKLEGDVWKDISPIDVVEILLQEDPASLRKVLRGLSEKEVAILRLVEMVGPAQFDQLIGSVDSMEYLKSMRKDLDELMESSALMASERLRMDYLFQVVMVQLLVREVTDKEVAAERMSSRLLERSGLAPRIWARLVQEKETFASPELQTHLFEVLDNYSVEPLAPTRLELQSTPEMVEEFQVPMEQGLTGLLDALAYALKEQRIPWWVTFPDGKKPSSASEYQEQLRREILEMPAELVASQLNDTKAGERLMLFLLEPSPMANFQRWAMPSQSSLGGFLVTVTAALGIWAEKVGYTFEPRTLARIYFLLQRMRPSDAGGLLQVFLATMADHSSYTTEDLIKDLREISSERVQKGQPRFNVLLDILDNLSPELPGMGPISLQVPAEMGVGEVLSHFFYYGSLPPASDISTRAQLMEHFETFLLDHPNELADIMRRVFSDRRHVEQFLRREDERMVRKVLEALGITPELLEAWLPIQDIIRYVFPDLTLERIRMLIYLSLFELVIQTRVRSIDRFVDTLFRNIRLRVDPAFIFKLIRSRQWITEEWKGQGEIREAMATAMARFEKADEEEQALPGSTEGYQCPYSGLVLFNPYLMKYFEMLELVEGNAFKNEEAAKRAVLLLHYLAMGESSAEEYLLVFNKILCGLPVTTPVPQSIELTEQEKEVTDSLWQGFIQNWPKLKSSSPEAIRETFLQRPGVLREMDDRWELTVDRKTQDILMDNIPWNFRLVKYPWMEKRVTVEWKTSL